MISEPLVCPQVIYKIDIPANRYDMLCLEVSADAILSVTAYTRKHNVRLNEPARHAGHFARTQRVPWGRADA